MHVVFLIQQMYPLQIVWLKGGGPYNEGYIVNIAVVYM